MTSTFDGYNYLLRFDLGENVHAPLLQFLGKNEIAGGWLSGIGGATEVNVGFYNLKSQEYKWKTYTELVEILSLQGTVALDETGKPVVHLHGNFANSDYQMFGGHVKELKVGGTLELFLHRSYQPWYRKRDEKTGLNLLDL